MDILVAFSFAVMAMLPIDTFSPIDTTTSRATTLQPLLLKRHMFLSQEGGTASFIATLARRRNKYDDSK